MSWIVIVLLSVIGIIVLLAIAALIRTFFIKPGKSAEKSAIEYSEEEEKLYAERLSEMVKVPTVSLRGNTDFTEFENLHKVMEKLYPNIFSKLEKTEFDGNLIFRWPGSEPEREGLLLMGHQDVVTAEEKEWKRDPFSGAIEDCKVHGRGSGDCKCTVCAEFSAVEELISEGFKPTRDIYLSSSVDEEITGPGAPAAVKRLKDKGVRLAAVMDEGGAIVSGAMPGMKGLCAVIGIVEKGYTDVKVIARGAGGHSSTPPRNTPIARLAQFVSEVERKRPFKKKMTEPVVQMFEAMAPYMDFGMKYLLSNLWLFKPLLTWLLPVVSSYGESLVATTFAFTMCAGSRTPNVIPDEAYVICNLRPAIHQNSDESVAVLKKIAKKYDLEVEILEERDASDFVDIKGDEFKYLKECVRSCFPGIAVAPYYISGGTDCRNYEEVSDNCLRFCAMRMDPQQLESMHAANENVSVDALAECVKFYKYYLKNHS